MKEWKERPQEVANLLNPAFCGRIIYECIRGYGSEDQKPMPYVLGFLVLPLVLHPPTRMTMAGTTRHFQVWLNGNQQIKLGLATRARTLVPFGREAMTFLWQTGTVEIQEPDASLAILKELRRVRRRVPLTDDFRDALKKSDLLGKWFSRINSPTTIYASLGLMP